MSRGETTRLPQKVIMRTLTQAGLDQDTAAEVGAHYNRGFAVRIMELFDRIEVEMDQVEEMCSDDARTCSWTGESCHDVLSGIADKAKRIENAMGEKDREFSTELGEITDHIRTALSQDSWCSGDDANLIKRAKELVDGKKSKFMQSGGRRKTRRRKTRRRKTRRRKTRRRKTGSRRARRRRTRR